MTAGKEYQRRGHSQKKRVGIPGRGGDKRLGRLGFLKNGQCPQITHELVSGKDISRQNGSQ